MEHINFEHYGYNETMPLNMILDIKNVQYQSVEHVSKELKHGESFFEESGQETTPLAKKIINKKTDKEGRVDTLNKPGKDGDGEKEPGLINGGGGTSTIVKENNGDKVTTKP